jgi:hypothetical protein
VPFAQSDARGLGAADNRIRGPGLLERASPMATKRSSGSVRLRTPADDRIRPLASALAEALHTRYVRLEAATSAETLAAGLVRDRGCLDEGGTRNPSSDTTSGASRLSRKLSSRSDKRRVLRRGRVGAQLRRQAAEVGTL